MSETSPSSASAGANKLEASFSTLILSIGSTAAMALGLAPNPQTGKNEPDPQLARFNIDLLVMLKDKTKNNLSPDEDRFLEHMVSDLQLAFIRENKATSSTTNAPAR